MSKITMPAPSAWMLATQTMGGDIGWKLSWSQSGAGVCNRLSGESHEKALITAAQAEAYADARAQEQTAHLQDMLRALVEQMSSDEAPNGDAPGHHHNRAGIWDMDNGDLSGKPCAWCSLWKEACALIKQQPTGENNV